MAFLNKPGGNKRFLSWFGLIMVLVYIAFGLFILTDQYFSKVASENVYRTGLGWLLIIYGLFRAYRVFIDFKSKDDFDE